MLELLLLIGGGLLFTGGAFLIGFIIWTFYDWWGIRYTSIKSESFQCSDYGGPQYSRAIMKYKAFKDIYLVNPDRWEKVRIWDPRSNNACRTGEKYYCYDRKVIVVLSYPAWIASKRFIARVKKRIDTDDGIVYLMEKAQKDIIDIQKKYKADIEKASSIVEKIGNEF